MMPADDLKRILGVDYGSRRIGVAVSDPLFLMASPLITVLNNHTMSETLLNIITEKNVVLIVLGYPFQENGKASSNAGEVMKFKQMLEKNFKGEVVLWDERYTSEMAKDMIIEAVTRKSKRREKGLVDRGAAAIILQEYLDSKRDELRKLYL